MKQFRPGDVVKGCFEDEQWYFAEIEKDNGDGTYTISWFDGDPSHRVKPPDSLVRMKWDSELKCYQEDVQHMEGFEEQNQHLHVNLERFSKDEVQASDEEWWCCGQVIETCKAEGPNCNDERAVNSKIEDEHEYEVVGEACIKATKEFHNSKVEVAQNVQVEGKDKTEPKQDKVGQQMPTKATVMEPKDVRKHAEDEAEARQAVFDFDMLDRNIELEKNQDKLLYGLVPRNRHGPQ